MLNFVINFMVIIMSIDTLRAIIVWWRVAISASIGAIYVCLLTNFGWINFFGLKIVLALVMVAVMAKHKTFKRYIGLLCVFFAYTFFLGGVAQGLFNLTVSDGIYVVSNNIRPLLVGGAMLIAYLLIRIAFINKIEGKRQKNFVKPITICVDDKTCSCLAYWDSGNKLYYRTNRPVMVVDNFVISKLFDNQKCEKIKDYIAVDTVTGNKKLPLYLLDKVAFDNEKNKNYYNVYAVASEKSLKNYGAILNCDM